MQKVVFIDLDDTLFNSDLQVSETTKESLAGANARGFECVIASGRTRSYIGDRLEDFPKMRYAISGNGAEAYDFVENKILFQSMMDADAVMKLWNLAVEHDVRVVLAIDDEVYVNKTKRSGENVIDKLTSEFLDEHKITQVTISGPDFEIIRNLRPEIEAVPNIKIANQNKSLVDPSIPLKPGGSIYYNIVSPECSKGNAVKKFCEIFNIAKENTIAIGDDHNDVSMFEEVGTKVVVANALPNVLEMADLVIGSNDDDGVAKFLDNLA